jgi:ABC-type proline/glycine betaine transport system permease subunit
MIVSAGLSIAIFVFLTFVYFGTKFFLVDRKGPPMQTGVIKTVLIMTYLILVIGSQLGININNSKEHCQGVPQIVTSMLYTIIPNFFMLGLVIILLKVFPGWKEPFSNTIGYGIVYIMGLGETFSELLKSKKVAAGKTGGDLLSMICENKSIVINQITPFNFELFMNRMSKEGALKTGYKRREAYDQLWKFVNIKDAIAEMVWYLLTGALVISTSFNAIFDTECDIPVAQRKAAAAKFNAEMSKKETQKPNEKLFTVHD